jgi:phosphoribosylformylglycinamidine synthase
VEVSNLGEFTNSGFLCVNYQDKPVARIGMHFLHEGLPPMVLKAKWLGPQQELQWSKPNDKFNVKPEDLNSRHFLENALFNLLERWNICSKENWVRRYDHEVQAATLGKPFVGKNAEGPGDAGVLWLAPHGGEANNAVAIGCGLQPKLSRYDAYLMAQHALDEAIRNVVAVGGDPDQIAVIDNFCWPDPLPSEKNPDATHKLAQLVRAAKALKDLAEVYGTPFVSGKDSMKNDFIGRSRFGKEVKISVPPTVLVTAMARVPDIKMVLNSAFKNAGDYIFVVGALTRGLGGSEFSEAYDLNAVQIPENPPSVMAEQNLKLYRALHQAMKNGYLQSCHDCSEGGMLVALAESALGGGMGVRADLDKQVETIKNYGGSLAELFFHEAPGRFIVSVAEENLQKFLQHFSELPCLPFGRVQSDPIIRIMRFGLVVLDAPLERIQSSWKGAKL